MSALLEVRGERIGNCGLLAPYESTGLFHEELAGEFAVKETQRFFGGKLGRPQVVVRRHRQ